MTTPDERYFSIQKTRKFLLDLCHNMIPKKDIPKYASMCLRHFPSEPYMELLRERSQDILGQPPPSEKED